MSSTDNLPRPADSPCLKCASAGCTTIRNEFYKCRGCGQVVTFSDERETMLVINGATVKVNLDSGKTEKRVYAIFAGCDQGRVYLLHRCDRSRVCVCDFIGFEVQENG